MSESPTSDNVSESEHAWVHDQMAAYIAGGLDAEERGRFDTHVNACVECFDAFTEARDADRAVARAVGSLLPAEKLEERLIFGVRELAMKSRTGRIFLKRAGYATAAALALAATGVFANYAMHQDGVLNNPLTQRLVAQADRESPAFANNLRNLADAGRWDLKANTAAPAYREVDAAEDLRGIAESTPTGGAMASAAAASQPGIFRGGEKDLIDVPAGAESRDLNAQALGNQARELGQKGDVEKAADMLKQAVALDPSNEALKLQWRLADDQAVDQRYEGLVHRMNEATKQQTGNFDAMIPYVDASTPANQLIKGLEAGQAVRGTGVDGIKGDLTKTGTSALSFSRDAVAAGGRGGAAGAYDVALVPVANGDATGRGDGVAGAVGVEKFKLDMRTIAGKDEVGFEFGANDLRVNNLGIQAGSDFGIRQSQATGETALAAIPRAKSYIEKADEVVRNPNDVDKPAVNELKGTLHTLDSEAEQKFQQSMSSNYDYAIGPTAGETGAAPKDPAAASDPAAITDLAEVEAESITRRQREVSGSRTASTPVFAAAPAPVAATQAAAAPTPAAPAATTAPAVAPPVQPPAAEVAVRKVIRNGTVEFEVRSFEDTYTTVSTVVSEEGGFVSSTSSDKLANGKVRGNIVVRVPPDHLDRFLMKIRALGELKSQQIGAQDVTKEFTDIESELRGLRTMEGRLLDLIKNGKGEVKDLVEAEKNLGEYRIRIEKLEGEIRYYNNLVGMATLTIAAYEKDIQKPTAASEQEAVNLSVETEEVETKYQTARKVLDDVKARIVESQLKNTDAEHIAALIVADVAPDKADFVAAQLKQLGKVASFTRDRRQTTTGGSGVPDVQVEHKDTRFSISMYNLANLAPRETTVLVLAVRDVEATYRKVLSEVRQVGANPPPPAPAAGGPGADKGATDGDAKETHAAGRVIASALNGQQADQMSADVRAEVRAEQADAVVQAIRDTGEVITSSLAVNPDNAQTTGAKRGIQLRLVNIAAVPPKETVTMNIAVRDVEASAAKIRGLVERPPGSPAVNLPRKEDSLFGRIQSSVVNGQQPEQMTADIRAEVRSDEADAVLSAIRDTGEVLSSVSSQNPDPINVTASKRGIVLRLINVASVAPRETQTVRLVAADVTVSYNKLLNALQPLAREGNARVITSALAQADPKTINATLQFEVRRDQMAAVDKAFADAGVDFVSRTINHSANTVNTLDSKILFNVEAIRSAESLEPQRTFTVTREVDNVEQAMDRLRSSISGTPVKETDFNTQNAQGHVSGHIVLESPTSNTMTVLAGVRDLGGVEKDNQVTKNAQVPDTRFARDRIDLHLINKPRVEVAPLVAADQGLGPTVRAALSRAAGALLFSLYLVVMGLVVILPFALIAWPVWAVAKRRRAAVRV